jgi:O-antigen/teichoic acid export membrane protein
MNFLLNYLLIPYLGALGNAVATAFTYLFLSAAYLFMSQRLHPIPLEHKKLVLLLALLVVTIALGMFFNSYNWNLYITAGKTLWLIFLAGFFFYFKIIDLQQVKQIFLRKKHV